MSQSFKVCFAQAGLCTVFPWQAWGTWRLTCWRHDTISSDFFSSANGIPASSRIIQVLPSLSTELPNFSATYGLMLWLFMAISQRLDCDIKGYLQTEIVELLWTGMHKIYEDWNPLQLQTTPDKTWRIWWTLVQPHLFQGCSWFLRWEAHIIPCKGSTSMLWALEACT